MKCSSCGTENAPEYKYCGTCGTPLHTPVAAKQVIDSYVPISQRHYTATAQRKMLSGRVQAWIVIGALAFLALCLCIIGTQVTRMMPSPVPSSQVPTTLPIGTQLPTFSVIGRDKSSFSLLVPPNTTDEQLAQLIYAFRQARKNNSLGRMGIPATTPGTKYGDYAVVELYVFTEPEWASESTLKTSTMTSFHAPFYDEYNTHVKAYYYYGVAIGTSPEAEEGSIGYAEGSKTYSSTYRKLF